MSHVDKTENRFQKNLLPIIKDLQKFLSSVQRPHLADAKWTKSMTELCHELESRLVSFRNQLNTRQKLFSQSFDAMINSLKEYSQELADNPNVKKVNAICSSMSQNYEELLAQLQKAKGLMKFSRAFHIKPINYTRNVFHMLSGTVAVLLYEFVLTRAQAITALLITLFVFSGLEISRRYSKRWNNFLVHKCFGIVARPFEKHRTNSSTYFLLALTIITILFPKVTVEMAVLILSFADPLASITGRLWGKRKLINDKSYIGTITFFAVSLIITILLLPFIFPSYPLYKILLMSGIVSLAATLTELISTRIDDNFSIPVVTAATAFLMINIF